MKKRDKLKAFLKNKVAVIFKRAARMRVMYGFVGFFVAAPALVADEIGVGE